MAVLEARQEHYDKAVPLYRKAIRVSVGAALTTPFARAGSASELGARLISEGFAALALAPGGAVELSQVGPAARRAVLFGAEGPGLPAAVGPAQPFGRTV